MKNVIKFLGIITLTAVIGFVIGCSSGGAGGTSQPTKKIDDQLIGKWEWEKIISDGEEYSLTDAEITSGGYTFTSNSFTSYVDGEAVFTFTGVYTQNNAIYTSNGQRGYTYSISGNKLTAKLPDSQEGVIASKVSKFSWE